MSEPAPLVELREVTAGYGREVAIEGVSLAIHRRDFLAILGPNGGGKTTLLKVILGLHPHWSGEVVHRHSGRRGALGYVPQFAAFDRAFPLRVHEVVRMGRLGVRGRARRYRASDRGAVAAALERLRLGHLAGATIGELSGGQLQRTLIARALVGEPEILLLDEPLASVDPEARGRLVATLTELNETLPVVVITHDLTPLAPVVRQIACMNRRLHYHPDGKLTAEALEEVYGCPVELVSHGIPHRVLPEHGAPAR